MCHFELQFEMGVELVVFLLCFYIYIYIYINILQKQIKIAMLHFSSLRFRNDGT